MGNEVFFVFLYILGLLTTYFDNCAMGFPFPKHNLFAIFFDLYLLCLFLMILPKNVRKWIKGVVAILLYSVALVDTFCVEKFSIQLGPEILNVLLETNQRESTEFLHEHIHFDLLWSGIGLILLLLIVHLLFANYASAIMKKWREFSMSSLRIILSLVLIAFVLLSTGVAFDSRIKLVEFLGSSDLEHADLDIDNHFQNTPVTNILFAMKMKQLSNKDLDKLVQLHDSVTIDSCDNSSIHLVLIIGESYIKSHSQLYWYEKATTPRQVARLDSSNHKGILIPFTDVVSPSNLTSLVFKYIFSLYSVDSPLGWSHYPLFPVLFRKSGYQVTFITNQYVQSSQTDIINFIGGLFLNDERLSKLQFSYRNKITHSNDMDLLADYDSLRQYNTGKDLTVFHLIGQHSDFQYRCPEEYKVFKPSDYDYRRDLSNAEKKVVADYDNATYYNDMVVDSIITTFSADDALVVYIPDHGEECYDGELHRIGRIPNSSSEEVLKNEYRVPLWIWCSDKYMKSHPDMVKQMKDARHRPFMTDDIPHLLLYLAGIHCSYYEDKRNLISPKYDLTRKRMICGVSYQNRRTER